MKEHYATRALTFEYHGIASREVDASRALAARAGVREHRLVRLPDLREIGDIDGVEFKGLPPTYIPMRNSIFYAFAAAYAEETGAGVIVGGHNKDDTRVFLDVGEKFFDYLEKTLWAGSSVLRKRRVRIVRPLKQMTKPEVISLAARLGVPLELTWSCHSDGKEHCWKCDGCRARRASFTSAGVPDPLASLRRAKIT